MPVYQRASAAPSRGSGGCLELNADSKGDLFHPKQMNRKALERIIRLTITVPGGNTKHKKHQIFMHLSDTAMYLRDKLVPSRITVDFTFCISDWSMESALRYLEPLRNLPNLNSLRIKTIANRSHMRDEEKLAFHKHCRNLAHELNTGPKCKDQQAIPTAKVPSATILNQQAFPFANYPWRSRIWCSRRLRWCLLHTEAYRRLYQHTQRLPDALENVGPDLVAGVQEKRHTLPLASAIQA